MQESVIYQDILQKGNKQGEERTIIRQLNRRFGEIDSSLTDRIRVLLKLLLPQKSPGLQHLKRPISRTANAVMPNVLVSQAAIAGDRCASTQIVMPLKPDD